MMRFLLVLGTWHGAWCERWWRRSRVRTSAHAIDLPGHEAGSTPAATVTLEDYVCAIGAALRARGGRSEPVGHSIGGILETRAVETTARLEAAN